MQCTTMNGMHHILSSAAGPPALCHGDFSVPKQPQWTVVQVLYVLKLFAVLVPLMLTKYVSINSPGNKRLPLLQVCSSTVCSDIF